jgi:alkanesulfonate monooxygenase SsuD/methylene tetrahydromethanopterin reductase-like flavin-dependent oxidoreductase (luciferase family)
MNVAAELGDGWIPALVARDSVAASAARLGQRRETASPHAPALTVAAGPIAVADENPGTARDIAAASTAWYLCAMGDVYARSLAGQGYAAEVSAVIAANPRPSPRRGTIPPEAQVVLDQLAACGTPVRSGSNSRPGSTPPTWSRSCYPRACPGAPSRRPCGPRRPAPDRRARAAG